MIEFSELISKTEEYRPLKSDLLIIMPAFSSNKNVEIHLGYLSRQSFQKFNVLIVAGIPLDKARLGAFIKRKRFRFGVIVAEEKDRLGYSGAMFAGQRYVLDKGYSYFLMGDDDCWPVDPKLVENLYRRRKVGYVACTRHLVVGNYRKVVRDFGVGQYCLLARGILEKYGLNYLPMFHGADDGEYAERIAGEKKIRIGNYIEHPYIAGMRLFSIFDRSWLFFLHALIIAKGKASIAYNIALISVMLPVCLIFLPPYGRKLFFTLTRLFLTYTYGRTASDQLKSGFEGWIAHPSLPNAKGASIIDDKRGEYVDLPSGRKLSAALSASLANFRKEVAIEDCQSLFKGLMIAAAAKRCHVRTDQGMLLLSDNRSFPIHIAKILLLPIVSLLYFLLMALVFVPIKIIKQPRTMRYGL